MIQLDHPKLTNGLAYSIRFLGSSEHGLAPDGKSQGIDIFTPYEGQENRKVFMIGKGKQLAGDGIAKHHVFSIKVKAARQDPTNPFDRLSCDNFMPSTRNYQSWWSVLVLEYQNKDFLNAALERFRADGQTTFNSLTEILEVAREVAESESALRPYAKRAIDVIQALGSLVATGDPDNLKPKYQIENMGMLYRQSSLPNVPEGLWTNMNITNRPPVAKSQGRPVEGQGNEWAG